MKTTIELPGLRLVLDVPPVTAERPDLSELMWEARGVVDSGVPNLASNPDHMTGFGRDAGHR